MKPTKPPANVSPAPVAPIQDLAGSGDQVRALGELTQLLVVEDQAVDAADDLDQLVPGDVDPQIHRIQCDEPGVGALLADLELQSRLDVGEEQNLRGARRGRELGLEVLEHVQLGVKRLTRVEVPAVLALPEERLAAGDTLDVVDLGATGAQDRQLLLTEVVTDRADDVNLIEQRRGEREVGGRSAEHPRTLAERRLDGIEGDRTDDRDAHATTASGWSIGSDVNR